MFIQIGVYCPKKQKPVFNIINTTLQFKEFNIAINPLTLHRAAGDSVILPNVIKALDKGNKVFLFEICSELFENKVEIEEWQIDIKKTLSKRKPF